MTVPSEWDILQERAVQLALREKKQTAARGAEMVIVRIGDERFALSAQAVERVIPLQDTLPTPGTKAWLPGVTLYQDNPVSLLDVTALLGKASSTFARLAVVVRTTRGLLALVAHELLGLAEVHEEDIELIPTGEHFARRLTADRIRLIDHEDLANDPRVSGLPPLPR